MKRRIWTAVMALVVIGASGSGRSAVAQPVDDGCYELGSLCTNGRQCCSGICERDNETLLDVDAHCTNGGAGS
jgi:hypothetical protein